MTLAPRLRVIGPGRAGRSLASALNRAGWQVVGLLGRGDDHRGAADGADLVLITTPDAAIAEVAAGIEPSDRAVVAHAAGSLGLDVLARLGTDAPSVPVVVVSAFSPVGLALVGRGAGEVVDIARPDGRVRSLRVVRIGTDAPR